jgi:hypothetical protein
MKFFSLILFIIGGVLQAQEKSHLKYPVISETKGIVVLSQGGKVEKIKKSEVLHEKAHLVLKAGAQVRIDISEKTSLVLLQSSEIDIPLIDWEDGKVGEVDLIHGVIRVSTEEATPLVYATPVSRDSYSKGDFLLSYDSHMGRASMEVFRGVLNFRGLENEVSARVGPGETASFQSTKENGVPSFDILLKGRKVARGNLSNVSKVPEKQFLRDEKSSLLHKTGVKTTAKKRPLQSDQICENPNAKLNDCVWTCEGLPKKMPKQAASCEDPQLKGVYCLRRRCDANGEWSDAYKMSTSEGKCQLKPVISACDY